MSEPETTKADKPSAKKDIDWAQVEVQYRAGILSDRAIAKQHGTTHRTIGLRADKEGWTRDLSAKIRAKAEALVSRQAVSSEVSTPEKVATEKQVIEANATLQANLIREHRTEIGRYRNLAKAMVQELEVLTGEPLDLEQLILAVGQNEPDVAAKLSKLSALPSRIKGLSDLSTVLKTLVGLERQAFGIADNAEGDKPPPAPPPSKLDDDAVRRFAFLLAKASQA